MGLAVFTFSSLVQQSLTVIRQHSEKNATQIGVINGGNVVINPPIQKVSQVPDDIDIKGTWNYEEAKKIALPYLLTNSWSKDKHICKNLYPCNPIHTFIGDYNLSYRNREVLIVVAATIDRISRCHSCSPALSLFEFEKRPTGWKLVNSFISAMAWGTWNVVKQDEIKVMVIGDNRYGIVLEGGWMFTGTVGYSTAIYAYVGDSLSEVLSPLQTFENNGGIRTSLNRIPEENWNSHIKVQPGATGFFDLTIETEGIRRGKSFKEKKLFKFNGKKYINSGLYN